MGSDSAKRTGGPGRGVGLLNHTAVQAPPSWPLLRPEREMEAPCLARVGPPSGLSKRRFPPPKEDLRPLNLPAIRGELRWGCLAFPLHTPHLAALPAGGWTALPVLPGSRLPWPRCGWVGEGRTRCTPYQQPPRVGGGEEGGCYCASPSLGSRLQWGLCPHSWLDSPPSKHQGLQAMLRLPGMLPPKWLEMEGWPEAVASSPLPPGNTVLATSQASVREFCEGALPVCASAHVRAC